MLDSTRWEKAGDTTHTCNCCLRPAHGGTRLDKAGRRTQPLTAGDTTAGCPLSLPLAVLLLTTQAGAAHLWMAQQSCWPCLCLQPGAAHTRSSRHQTKVSLYHHHTKNCPLGGWPAKLHNKQLTLTTTVRGAAICLAARPARAVVDEAIIL